MLKSKSGLNVKYGITSEGVIDCGYNGSIAVKLYGGYVLFDYQGKRYTYYNCFVESIAEIG